MTRMHRPSDSEDALNHAISNDPEALAFAARWLGTDDMVCGATSQGTIDAYLDFRPLPTLIWLTAAVSPA